VNLEKYTELTGITVASENEAKVKATIRRTKTQLESMLGFTLKPKNLYTEIGKVQFEGYLPIIEDFTNLDDVTLLDADEEQGVYKLFPFEDTDQYFHVDPFKNVYKVKLVMPLPDGDFITLVDFDNIVPQYGRDNIGKYIERHYEWFTWEWYKTWRYSWKSHIDAGMMMAVDADWIDCYPDDLMYLWADMVTYYLDPSYSLTGNMKSESVDGHSWTKGGGSSDSGAAPQENNMNRLLLARYAGPFGSIARNPVR
jgi:hypothetical protein